MHKNNVCFHVPCTLWSNKYVLLLDGHKMYKLQLYTKVSDAQNLLKIRKAFLDFTSFSQI